MRSRSLVWVILFAFGLALIAALVSSRIMRNQAPALPGLDRLPDTLLLDPGGMGICVELPLGETERASASAQEILDFSDFRYVSYRDTTDLEFTVYLAYWKSRAAHFLEVATHAPDNCWVRNGMQLSGRLSESILVWPGFESHAGNLRIFQNSGQEINVIYWHFLAGETLSYLNYDEGKTFGFMADNFFAFRKGDGEQFFLRVASERTIEELSGSPLFRKLMEQLDQTVPLRRSRGPTS